MSKTHIFMVCDRSGSMATDRVEIQGGINQFIEAQAKEPGKCRIHLYQFDTKFEHVFSGKVKNAPKYTLKPRGMTALNDAVGRTIAIARTRTGKDDLVILVIATDGLENASREYKAADVKKLIERMERKHKWQITFLGADIDAFNEGAQLGINPSKTMQFDKSVARRAYGVVGQAVARTRSTYTETGVVDDLQYTSEDRANSRA